MTHSEVMGRKKEVELRNKRQLDLDPGFPASEQASKVSYVLFFPDLFFCTDNICLGSLHKDYIHRKCDWCSVREHECFVMVQIGFVKVMMLIGMIIIIISLHAVFLPFS